METKSASKSLLLKTRCFAASRVQSEAYMDCLSPVLAPSALDYRPPVQNRECVEKERQRERERERERERVRERD